MDNRKTDTASSLPQAAANDPQCGEPCILSSNNSTPNDRTLESERTRLERRGRLSSVHWGVIGLSLCVTAAAWYSANSAQLARAEQRFDREADRVVSEFTDQLDGYANVLRGTVATIVSKQGEITAEQWRRYNQSINLLNEFPDSSGVAVVRHVSGNELPAFLAEQRKLNTDYRLFSGPPGERNEASTASDARGLYLPVTLVAPQRLEDKLPGFDLAAHPQRRHTLLRAAHLNEIQMTPPIKTFNTGPVAILMAAPFYQGGEIPNWEARREKFAGAIVASVMAKDLYDTSIVRGRPMAHVEIYDADEVVVANSQLAFSTTDPNPLFSRSRSVSLYGRQWNFRLTSTTAFRSEIASSTPLMVLIGGLAIDALLLLLFVSVTRGKREAIAYGDYATVQLLQRSRELEQANNELAQFAHIVSHDLKTPLNGIQQITGFIEEDLEHYENLADAKRFAGEDLSRIRQQVSRSYTLIEGILSYSKVGTREELIEPVDIGQLIQEISETLQLEPGALIIDDDLPTLLTARTRLSQVFANLIGNAFKYHHDRSQALVRLSMRRVGDYYRFTVADNGPGIDEKFHERVFRPFETLQSRDLIESSGVGLAIVKKSVEKFGGNITLTSALNQGSAFTFDWPVTIDDQSGKPGTAGIARAA